MKNTIERYLSGRCIHLIGILLVSSNIVMPSDHLENIAAYDRPWH